MTEPIVGPIYPPCGFVASCGRRVKHRGHHGGWRTGIAVVMPNPYDHAERSMFRLGSELTPVNLTVLAEYARHGAQQSAAACMGMPLQTLKGHISAVHARTGAQSTLEVFWLLGWLTIPAGLGAAVHTGPA